MKICILTPRFPFPQYGGDVLRINEIARYLKSVGHTLVLVSLSDEETPSVDEASILYNKVYYVHRNRICSYVNGIKFMMQDKPLQCGYYYSSAYRQLLKDVIDKEHPDLYISHLLRMTPYLEEFGLQRRSIVEMTDALSKTYSMSSNAKNVGMLKYVYGVERHFVGNYEQHVINAFPKVVLVSQADVDYLQAKSKSNSHSLAMYTNGVDTMDSLPKTYDPDKICFIGNMRSMQNQDAVIYFVKDIFPLIKQKKPNAKFHVVGSLPPANIKALASDDVIVTGFIDDLQTYISDSCLAVAPVRVAAGIQNKVLVAMGCGLPVVMTSLISTAVPELSGGSNCIISDTPQSIADACVCLMSDTAKRNVIGKNGYEMVRENYSWSNKLNGYELIG